MISNETKDVNKAKDDAKNINNKECIICMDRVKDHACVPCGHQCLCQVCKDKMDDKCQVCREKYECIIKIYQ